MFKLSKLALVLSIAATSISAAPLEPDAIYKSDWTKKHAQALANDASMLIRRAGYRCDTESSISKWVFSVGFDITCNSYRYKYEVEDRGGEWEARLK